MFARGWMKASPVRPSKEWQGACSVLNPGANPVSRKNYKGLMTE
jgi:hypothetical protein